MQGSTLTFTGYIIIGFLIGALFFTLAILGLNWAIRNGQFKDLDKGSRVIFDEDEPEGEHTDYFPGKQPDNQSKS